MEYKYYEEKLISELEKIYTDGKVLKNEQLKLNGVKLVGVNLISENVKAAPVFYIEPYYNNEMRDEDITKLAERIVEFSKNNQIDMEDFDLGEIEGFREYNHIKERIMPILVNTAMNKELLEKVPHREWLDLSIIYIVDYKEATIRLYNNHLEMWGITEEVLYEQAMSNLKKQPREVLPIMEMLIDEYKRKGDTEHVEELSEILKNKDGDSDLYVVSNNSRRYGAAICMLKDTMRELAETIKKKQVIFVLSSVHEFIIFNMDEIDKESLEEMVRAVNRTSVDAQEVLSDNVYVYDKERDDVTVW